MMNFKKLIEERNTITIVLFILLFCALCPYLYLAKFAHPISDDYCYTLLGLKENYLETAINEYFRWNGRYLSNLLVVLNPMVWDNYNFIMGHF